MAGRPTFLFIVALLGCFVPFLGMQMSPASPARPRKEHRHRHREHREHRERRQRRHRRARSSGLGRKAGGAQGANKTDTPLSIENRRWKSRVAAKCDGNKTEGDEWTTVISGESCPGPGIICDKYSGICATVIGDECCAPPGSEYWWCDIPPMCNADTPNSIDYPHGVTTHTKGIFCPTQGAYTTCYEALAHITIPQPGYFCSHQYFWPQHSGKTCTETLLNPDYNGLRFAKASCVNVGDDCWGVLDTNCDGYEYTKLCVGIGAYTNASGITGIGSHTDLVSHIADCVHEKTYRHPGSYFALCAETLYGSERVAPGYVFPEEGVFCTEVSITCHYVIASEVASAWGSYCHDEHLLLAPTVTYTTTTPEQQ